MKKNVNDSFTNKSKYFVNAKDSILSDYLTGLCLANKDLVYYKDHSVLVDSSQLKENKVRLICGGGSGHEPAHAGYVGKGMLTSAVCGDIFASPSYVNILKAIDLVYTDAGVLLLIKNYTGDLINFRLAKQIANEQGKRVELLIVDDDISLIDESQPSSIDNNNLFNKKRGLCGIVLVYKILGEMSRAGKSIDEMIEFGSHIIPNLFTVGVSLTTCSLPYTEDINGLYIPSDECEIGLGIHGEKGKERIKYHHVADILEYLFENFFNKHLFKQDSINDNNLNDIVIMINNLGSLTDIEIYTIINSVHNYIANQSDIYKIKINVRRIIYGRLMTSLDMKGFSLTMFTINNRDTFLDKNKDYIISLIDQEIDSKNWNILNAENINLSNNIVTEIQKSSQIYPETKIKSLFKEICEFLITQSNHLNNLDKEVGDGDLGSGVEKSLNFILSKLDFLDFENNLSNSFRSIGNYIASSFGGTSGPLYAAFFIKGSEKLNPTESLNDHSNWIDAYESGIKMIQLIGRAQIGDRTMLDMLFPLCEVLVNFYKTNNQSDLNQLKALIDVEINLSLERIKNLKSLRGRSSYMNGKEIGKDDPGCVLVAAWMKYLFKKIEFN